MSIEQLAIDDLANYLQAEVQRVSIEIENAERALRMHRQGLVNLVEPPSEQAIARQRAELADIRERLAEIARVQAEEREQAKREAEAAAAKRQKEAADARRAALVARRDFDRAQAARLQASLGGDIDAYAKAIQACEVAREEHDRAEKALAQVEE